MVAIRKIIIIDKILKFSFPWKSFDSLSQLHIKIKQEKQYYW